MPKKHDNIARFNGWLGEKIIDYHNCISADQTDEISILGLIRDIIRSIFWGFFLGMGIYTILFWIFDALTQHLEDVLKIIGAFIGIVIFCIFLAILYDIKIYKSEKYEKTYAESKEKKKRSDK